VFYSQLPLVAALYVLYAVLTIWLGAQLAAALGRRARGSGAWPRFFLPAPLANSLAGVIQFYGRPKLLEDVIAELHGNRAYGNIAQPNLYANYLALGEGALLFLWARARVQTAYALPALGILLLGSAALPAPVAPCSTHHGTRRSGWWRHEFRMARRRGA